MREEHKNKLLKLARYLESLPEDYAHFDMECYYNTKISKSDDYDKDEIECNLSECGSSACALGHGIKAGIPWPEGKEGDWDNYSWIQFGIKGGTREWSFLFGIGLGLGLGLGLG